MTPKLAQQAAPFIPYQRDYSDDFIYPEPEHKPDSMEQGPTIHRGFSILYERYAGRDDVLVDGGGEIYWDPLNRLRNKVSPDIYVAFGVDAAAIFSRDAYLIWEAGKPPDFALEVASKSTHDTDTESKPEIYQALGIGEYWRFDPSGGRYYGYALAGDILVDGVYQPIEVSRIARGRLEPFSRELNGMLHGYSPALGLALCVQGDRLLFFDPETGEFLRDLGEEQARANQEQTRADREQTRANQEQTRADREQARADREQARANQEQARADREQAGRLAAESELERARAELRRLQGQ